MVWVRQSLKYLLVPTPCHEQEHPPPDQVAQGHIQPAIEHLQGWGIRNFSEQPITAPHHCLCEEFPRDIQSSLLELKILKLGR